MVVSVLVFFAAYYHFAVIYKLQYFLYISVFIVIFFALIFKKTIMEKEIMEEPEKLLKHTNFAAYTIFLLFLFFIASILDKIGQ